MKLKIKNGNIRTYIKSSFFLGMIAFLISFLLQIILNRGIVGIRSLPDEMGAMYLAAQATGYDWSFVMTHPSYYYGFATFPFMYPFFLLIHNPETLYHCLLGLGAVLRSFPAIYTACILGSYSKEKSSIYIILLGITATFITPTRAVNIDNEPILIFICWTLFYLIFLLQFTENKCVLKKKILSFILAFILCFSLLAHTRAIVFTIVIILILILYKVLSRKWLVDIPYFCGTYVIFFIGSKIIISAVTKYLYPVELGELNNTGSTLVEVIRTNVINLFSPIGIQSFFDIFFSNIWVIFIFTGGILLVGFIFLFIEIKYILKNRFINKTYVETTDLVYPLLFSSLGLAIALIGVCIVWFPSAIDNHLNESGVSRGFFYLRYYGVFFGPFFVTVILALENIRKGKNKTNKFDNTGRLFIVSVFVLLIVLYCTYSYLSSSIIKGKQSDWFYYFAPLSFKKIVWPDGIQNYIYFYRCTLAALIFMWIIFWAIEKNKKFVFAFLSLLLVLYQYYYLVVNWDQPFSSSENYYYAANGIFEFKSENPNLFKSIDCLYFLGDSLSAQYNIQFMLLDTKVIVDVPPEKEENIVLLVSATKNLDDTDIDFRDYKILKLDENEILLVKGKEYINLVESNGIKFDSFYDS